jgi:hypothetical protein
MTIQPGRRSRRHAAEGDHRRPLILSVSKSAHTVEIITSAAAGCDAEGGMVGTIMDALSGSIASGGVRGAGPGNASRADVPARWSSQRTTVLTPSEPLPPRRKPDPLPIQQVST